MKINVFPKEASLLQDPTSNVPTKTDEDQRISEESTIAGPDDPIFNVPTKADEDQRFSEGSISIAGTDDPISNVPTRTDEDQRISEESSSIAGLTKEVEINLSVVIVSH